jgi:hypothetical protein
VIAIFRAELGPFGVDLVDQDAQRGNLVTPPEVALQARQVSCYALVPGARVPYGRC